MLQIVYFLVKDNDVLYGFTILFIFLLGIIFAGDAEKIYKRKDAQMIVIDEACGMMIAVFLVPYNIWIILLGFVLFRVFDIIKPPPARTIEGFSGSFGVMFDDIIAAIYTNFILQLITRVFHIG